jgi:hypothetical protein
MSYQFRHQKTFNSVPGLLHWLDATSGVGTINNGGYDRVITWQDLSSKSSVFTSQLAYAPIKRAKYVEFNRSLTSNSRHSIVAPQTILQSYYNIWNKPAKWGIYFTVIDFTGQAAATPNFFNVALVATSGGSNSFNLYHNSESLGDPDSRYYLLRRYDGTTTNINQSGYVFQWQNQITTFANILNSEATNNLTFYVNNTLGYTATANNTPPLVSPLVAQVIIGQNSDVTRNFGLCNHMVYDWTGYNTAQIAAFDLQVRALLEIEKLKYL